MLVSTARRSLGRSSKRQLWRHGERCGVARGNMNQKSTSDARNAQVYRLWASYLAIGMILALTLPTDVISTNSLIAAFTTSMSEIVPSINKATSVSKFPEVTKAYFSVMWAMQPVVTAFSLFRLRWTPKAIQMGKVALVSVLGVPMLVLFIYIALVLPGDVASKIDYGYSSGRGKAFLTLMSTSRPMLGFIGGVVLVVSVLFQYCILIAYPRMLLLQFTQREKS